MAVELVEQAAPAHHNRDTKKCCEQVRDAAALIRLRDQALAVAAHAINATKDEMDELIRAAAAPIYEANVQFNASRDDLADATSNLDAALNDLDNANAALNQWITECGTPQPPPDCEAKKRQAEHNADAANASWVAATRAQEAAERKNNDDKKRLDAAKDELKAAEDLRDSDFQVCEEDKARQLGLKKAAQAAFKEQTDQCPVTCRGSPPPPPTLVPGDVVKVVGSDDGVNFWTLSGRVKSEMTRSLYVDFAPKGGPLNFNGTYGAGDIEWQDHNRWSKRAGLVTENAHHSSSSIAGLYLQKGMEEAGTLKGLRMISDTGGDLPNTLTVIGTVRQYIMTATLLFIVLPLLDTVLMAFGFLQDDGVNFWTIQGTKGTVSAGTTHFTLDFSHAGGTDSAERLTADGAPDTHRNGAYTDGRIEFEWEPTCDTVVRGQIKWIKQTPSA